MITDGADSATGKGQDTPNPHTGEAEMTAKDDSMELVELLAEAMRHPLSGDEIGQWPAYRNYARRALTAIEASGRRIVPVEPTPAISRLSVGMSTTHEMARITFSPPLPR